MMCEVAPQSMERLGYLLAVLFLVSVIAAIAIPFIQLALQRP